MRKSFLIVSLLATICLVGCNHPAGGQNEPDPTPITPGEANHMSKSLKRGICYNSFSESDLQLMCPSISWAYNWGKATDSDIANVFDSYGIDFCPMVWTGSPDMDAMRAFVEKHPNTKYLLAFNEPNLIDQASMTPKEAAALWPEVVAAARKLNLKLVSPAMNYGNLDNYSDPTKWLDEFFRQPGVSIDDIDAISIHCYMSSVSAMEGFVKKFVMYNKPIWLTEFCAWDPAPSNADKQMDYMCQALNSLEQNPLVERYSWFMLKTGGSLNKVPFNQLVDKNIPSNLTPLGEIYTMFSSFDKTTYLNTCRAIHAGEYCATNTNTVVLRPTTDYEVYGQAGKNGLMLSSFGKGTELTYQIQVDKKASKLIVHYCSFANSTLKVLVDGKERGVYDMPRNGSLEEWTTVTIPVSIAAGQHTLILTPESGSCAFSGFEIK